MLTLKLFIPFLSYLVHVTEVQVLLISEIVESVHHVCICSSTTSSKLCLKAVFLCILTH